jgi:hypothetical protein
MPGLVIMGNNISQANSDGAGYEAFKPFVGKEVRVFLCSGAVLSGTLVSLTGKHAHIKRSNHADNSLEAVVNLDHMVSVTKV